MRRFVGAIVFLIAYAALSAPGLPGPLSAPKDVRLAELLPLSTWNKQFKITDGKDRGRTVPLTFHRDPDGRWNLVFGDYARIRMQNDVRHGLAMERLDLLKSRSYIVYEPALPILTSEITSGGAVRREASFKMFDIATGKLKRTGRVTHMVKQASPSSFDTPAGIIDGYYIEIDHRMDMHYAQLDMMLGLGCRLDDGPVFGTGQYTLTKLGIFTETKTAAAALSKG